MSWSQLKKCSGRKPSTCTTSNIQIPSTLPEAQLTDNRSVRKVAAKCSYRTVGWINRTYSQLHRLTSGITSLAHENLNRQGRHRALSEFDCNLVIPLEARLPFRSAACSCGLQERVFIHRGRLGCYLLNSGAPKPEWPSLCTLHPSFESRNGLRLGLWLMRGCHRPRLLIRKSSHTNALLVTQQALCGSFRSGKAKKGFLDAESDSQWPPITFRDPEHRAATYLLFRVQSGLLLASFLQRPY
jgi:hypothetical protein